MLSLSPVRKLYLEARLWSSGWGPLPLPSLPTRLWDHCSSCLAADDKARCSGCRMHMLPDKLVELSVYSYLSWLLSAPGLRIAMLLPSGPLRFEPCPSARLVA